MVLAETRADLLEAVTNVKADPFFYAIRFHESRHEDGLFRKIRAAVAGDTIQIVRVVYETGWIVHGRDALENSEPYRRHPEFIRREREICRDPDTCLGLPVTERLRALRARNPLDVFGIDFDVMPDGRMLFFEANASMALLSDASPTLRQNRREAERTLMTGFDRYLERLRQERSG